MRKIGPHLPSKDHLFNKKCGPKAKRPRVISTAEVFLEATTGFEPVIKALQASALPLGHVAIREEGFYQISVLRSDCGFVTSIYDIKGPSLEVQGYSPRFNSGLKTKPARRFEMRLTSCRRHFDGADNGIRTRDPHLGKVMLYQLSHVRARKDSIRRLDFAQGFF